MQPTAPMTVPFVDVVATRAEDGAICLAVVNRHRSERIRLRPRFDGSEAATPRLARIRTLGGDRSEEHTSELQSRGDLVCRLVLVKKTDTVPSLMPFGSG